MLAEALKLFKRSIITPAVSKRGGVSFSLPILTGAANAFLALLLAEKNKTVLAITSGIPAAEKLYSDLNTLSQDGEILEFPPDDSDEDNIVSGIRLKTAKRLSQPSSVPRIVVTPFAALNSPVPTDIKTAITLSAGSNIKFNDLSKILVEAGYSRSPIVDKEGTFSIRGGIIDIWSPGDELPIRTEFFGDELESLRYFSPSSQLSVEAAKNIEILCVKKSEGEEKTLISLLPKNSTIIAFDHCTYELLINEQLQVVYIGEPSPQGVPMGRLSSSPLPGFSQLNTTQARHPELFAAAAKRLDDHLKAAEQRGKRIFRFDSLSGGFETEDMIVLTKADRVYTRHSLPIRRKSVHHGQRITDLESLEPGEYVVHINHGIGRFLGSVEIITSSGRNEVFSIEYADGAKLHVPTAHAHLISRYIGVKGEEVHLHRLDGKKWAKDKENAERAVQDLAAGLLETQARRDTSQGFSFDINCEGLDAFEAAFPYQETVDQLAAIADVKKDMSSTKPMDRLICGDAGYGKTEVAMRAAYIAALNGKQTVVLAPTTVLSEQHFETFTSRFDGTPVRIECVSRFQTQKTKEGTFARLANGACDIVIGTHAVLNNKGRFKDLGLVIIDEEQRFGVRHKEFLKRLRNTADILTMSATPIPRTLYLSMTGARDLSLIRTAPRERVAVETKIITDSDILIRQAINYEIKRGGQVFFLHNRVSTLLEIEKRIKSLLPNVRTTVAHGQMEVRELAKRMASFERGESDVLISTTIVESGIDIPRANTILVDRADTFGMADLYQLRGRVGRSSLKGFAYFLLPPGGFIESDAKERLDSLSRHSTLGSGFNLALRDLEIRGAGNLLGAKQSGHIAAVGFSLYCKLLKRTIAMLKGEKPEDPAEARLNLDFINYSPVEDETNSAAAIPYDYIEEDSQRMLFIKRIATTSSEKEFPQILKELIDRYGKAPEAVNRLIKLSRLRIVLSRAGVDTLDVLGERAVFNGRAKRGVLCSMRLESTSADKKLAELEKAARQLCV